MNSIEELLADVAKREGCAPEEVEWYSWPQSFSTTSGPSGRAGGNTCSTWQVFAFLPPNGRRQRFCGGVWRHWNGKFMQPW